MNCPLNFKKLLVGALGAGVWINIVETIVHGKILHQRYTELTRMGFYFPQPRFPFMPVYVVVGFVMGFFMAWFYAVARDTLKPGPCTAVKVGLMIGLSCTLPYAVSAIAWSTVGKMVPVVTSAGILLDCVGGTLIAGALYRPKENATTAT